MKEREGERKTERENGGKGEREKERKSEREVCRVVTGQRSR